MANENRDRLFDVEGALAVLRHPDAELHLVMIESDDGGTYRTYHLDVDRQRVQIPFRTNLAATLKSFRRNRLEPYDEGWAPQPGEMAVASVDQIQSALFAAIDEGLRPERLGPLRQSEAVPPSSGELEPVRGYAAVVTSPLGEVRIFRRRDPVERLEKGRLSTILDGTRLERVEHVVAFDSGIDVVLWNNQLLIHGLGGFEALFFPRAARTAVALRFVEQLESRIHVSNVDGLRKTAEDDAVFANRLRRLERSRLMKEGDQSRLMEEMRRAIKRFGLSWLFLDAGGELAFPATPRWRWPFLAVLEDGLVQSAGSDRLYQSESKRAWDRRLVTGVVRDGDRIVALCGPGWRPLLVSAARHAWRNATTTFFVDAADGQFEIVGDDPDGRELRVVGPVDRDVLGELPECIPQETPAS
ncbi:MAG TPA: hypothetical protein VKR30_01070 [Candidatus Limnocylindrales bacterium]|nr:hypothetical protein [Candidatus Limnocylindrales bacterium]